MFFSVKYYKVIKINKVVIHFNIDRSSKYNVEQKQSCEKICTGSYDLNNVLKCPNYYEI